MRRALVGLGLCACASSVPPPENAGVPEAPIIRGLEAYERTQIAPEALRGTSGMARHPGGQIWIVGERDQRLFTVDLAKGKLELSGGIPVLGVPDGVDLESMAFIDETTVVFGTESKEKDRESDAILFAKLSADKAVVTEQIEFDYGAFETVGRPNRGVEAMCSVAGSLIAGAEQPVGDRFAPLLRVEVVGHKRSNHRLKLLSKEGKLSALACRSRPGGIELVGIERHYGTSLLVYFQLPQSGGPEIIEPIELLDITALYAGAETPNFEGVALLGDRDVLIVSDNDSSGGPLVPTEIVRLVLAADPASGGYRGMSR